MNLQSSTTGTKTEQLRVLVIPYHRVHGVLQCRRVCEESERRVHLSEKLQYLESLVKRMGAQHGLHHITPAGRPFDLDPEASNLS